VDGGVTVHLSVAGHCLEVPSRLTRDGDLEGSPDGAVFNGFHAGTSCSGCSEWLSGLVVEECAEDEDEGGQ
jgi:hypothetical protein